MTNDDNGYSQMIEKLLGPMICGLKDPVESQNRVLMQLLAVYKNTEYGKNRNAETITSLESYRNNFPVTSYDGYKSILTKIMYGDFEKLLAERPIGWAITRGTTKDENKFIPMTSTDLQYRVAASRAVVNYVYSNNKPEILSGVNLNLNFPSVVGALQMGDELVEYGYSSGIYTRFVSKNTPILSVPSQEEIDDLGGGKTIRDWEARFDLAYKKALNRNVTLVGGVAPTALDFGRYLYRQYGKYPKDLWDVQLMTLGSVPGINTKYEPALRAMYGPVAIREIYGATEGMFGQQIDTNRAWTPNYDLYLFEVQLGGKTKMLYELKPLEVGELVVSTPVLPRYKIGDLILSVKPPYFRCIGRSSWWTPFDYIWNEIKTLNLGRL